MDVFYQPDIENGSHFLDKKESYHCIRVLRKNKHDKITILDGKGNIFNCLISEPDFRKCKFKIIKKETSNAHKHPYIHIGISPTKSREKLEWFIEKSIEIGLHEISLLICEHSERKSLDLNRLKKKAISAMKQSMNPLLPKINPPEYFGNFVDKIEVSGKFIAFLNANNEKLLNAAGKNQDTLVLIGPEGDFANNEIQLAMNKGFVPVSLGTNRLRTETAGIVACHILNILNT